MADKPKPEPLVVKVKHCETSFHPPCTNVSSYFQMGWELGLVD